jgi:hypothetical protein
LIDFLDLSRVDKTGFRMMVQPVELDHVVGPSRREIISETLTGRWGD